MASDPIIVEVEADLESLVPLFLQQRNADMQSLQQALERGDFDAARRVGHRIAGASKSYGFDRVGDLGDAIEAASQSRALDRLTMLQSELRDYLTRLQVKIV